MLAYALYWFHRTPEAINIRTLGQTTYCPRLANLPLLKLPQDEAKWVKKPSLCPHSLLYNCIGHMDSELLSEAITSSSEKEIVHPGGEETIKSENIEMKKIVRRLCLLTSSYQRWLSDVLQP